MHINRLFLLLAPGLLWSATVYQQTNLISDIPGLAETTDPNLVNPWGVSASSTSPYWVSNQGTNTSTLYRGNGTIVSLVVNVPSPSTTPPNGPTGQVFNNTTSFVIPGQTSPATFIFDTLGGSINAWNNSQGTTAPVVASKAGAVYTGLALASNSSGNFLYAANFAGGSIDVYNGSFAPVTPSGTFRDPTLPSGYTPYNVQLINGSLYVEYVQVDPVTRRSAAGPGLGYVSVFDLNGNFVRRLISNGPLNAPWGIAIAPASFGMFGNDLLVGNFGNGEINAFDPISGAFLGTILGSSGPLVNSGLWAIVPGNTGTGSDPNAIYFAAGINGEENGLFGVIQATPEPATFALAALSGALLVGFARRARVRTR